MRLLLIPLLLFPVLAMGQSASSFRQVTFSNLGQPAENQTRFCTDCQATSPCTGGGLGAYAVRRQTGASTFIWSCTVGAEVGGGGGAGTVTSVDFSVPAPFSVSGNPITTNGTIALTWATGQSANRFLGSPNGTTGPVGLRSIVPADILTGSVTPSRCLHTNASGLIEVAAGDCGVAGGSVSSVALALPAIFSVSGSPVTSTGTLTGTLTNQVANVVFAGPTTGGATTPTFRALVAADIPVITESKLSLSDVTTANSSTLAHGFLRKLSGVTTDCLKGDGTWAVCPTGGTTPPAGSNTQIQFNNSGAFGGASNFLFTSATGQITANQGGNGNNIFYGRRTTDTGPTGNIFLFQNQAASTDLFKVDASGNTTVAGTMTMATTSGTNGILTVSSAASGGGVQLSTGTAPTCNAANRGLIWYVAGGAGVADTVSICAKGSNDAYAYRVMATIP